MGFVEVYPIVLIFKYEICSRGYIFPIKFYRKIYLHGKFVTEFCSFFSRTYVPLDE